MIELLVTIIKELGSGVLVLIFAFWVLPPVALLYLLRQRDQDNTALHECINEGLGELNKTVQTVVTMMGVIVYGKRGGYEDK